MARTKIGFVKKAAMLAVAAGLLGACQAADGTTQAPDTALVSAFMSGLGAVDPKEKPIDYNPRAPLALPAETAQLPAPETNVAGTNDANWPKQQESEELKEIKELYAGTDRMHDEPLTPEQMRGFKITGVTGASNRDVVEERRNTDLLEGDKMTREELRAESERAQQLKAQQAGINESGLATRRFLTEPPSKFSTPSPDAPMPEVPTKKAKASTMNKDKYDATPLDPRCLNGETEYCD
ncbi:hypothetical protein FMN50_04905 [Rhodobacterales bacterium]|nr:hypothetical protein FMN50_04905 [Rhodobacterales bacterium]